MNFSALNTHAIGLRIITASAVVEIEGAGSFNAGATASAQVILYSSTTADVINSVAVATTQFVIRFASATATLGCNAAANVDGYRIQFSNTEIVCTASSNANAVVQRQAAAFVTAQATNVAVGSRVAYASASLQAECDLTANSGVATFVSSVIVATAAMSSSSYVIWDATGAFTGSSLAISVGEKRAVAHTTLVASAALTAAATSGAFSSAQVTAQSNFTSTASIIHDVNASVSASSSLSSVSYNVSSASATFSGSSIAISVGHKKSVAHTTINANAAVSSAANSEVYNAASVAASAVVSSIAANYSSAQASCVAQSSVSSSAFNTANPNAAIIAHANISATPSTTHFATANIDGSCVITTAPSLVIDASAAIYGLAVSISIGDKILVGHAQFTGSADVAAVAKNNSNVLVASFGGYAFISSSAFKARVIHAEAHVSDSGYWIPGYNTYVDTTTTATVGYYGDPPSLKTVTDFNNVNHYFGATYITGTGFSGWTFFNRGSDSTFTWNETGQNPFSGGTYAGSATGGTVNQTTTVYVAGVGNVNVTHYAPLHTRLKDTITTVATWHPAVWVPTGYTPSASVVADCTVLTIVALHSYCDVAADCTNQAWANGQFAGSSITISTGVNDARARADVVCSATASAIGITLAFREAHATGSAAAAGTQYVDRYVDGAIAAASNAVAAAYSSVYVNALIDSAADTTEIGAINTAWATGVFSGSSVTISVGEYSRIGRAEVSATAEAVVSEFYVESWRLADPINATAAADVVPFISTEVVAAPIISNCTVTADANIDAYVSGSISGDCLTYIRLQLLTSVADAIGFTASSDVTAEATHEHWGKVDVTASAEVGISGMGVNGAFADFVASASVTAFPNVIKLLVNNVTIDIIAEVELGFVLVAQFGERSDGILIEVPPEDRSISVIAVDRTIYVKAA